MPDKNNCARCFRKTAPKNLHVFNGKTYGKGCLDYCLERTGSRGAGGQDTRVCNICGRTFLFNPNFCDLQICCFCCCTGPSYCNIGRE